MQNSLYGDQYFVELKGSRIADAIVQLRASIKQLKNDGGQVYAFVVSSNAGPRISTERQVWEKEFKKQGVKLKFFHSNNTFVLPR